MSWSIFNSEPLIKEGIIVTDYFGKNNELFSWFVKEYYPVIGQYGKVLVTIWKNGSGEVVYSEVFG